MLQRKNLNSQNPECVFQITIKLRCEELKLNETTVYHLTLNFFATFFLVLVSHLTHFSAWLVLRFSSQRKKAIYKPVNLVYKYVLLYYML